MASELQPLKKFENKSHQLTPLLLEIFQWIKNKCGSLWGQEYPLLANLRETVYKISITDYIFTMTYESPTARKYLRSGFKIVFKRKLNSQKKSPVPARRNAGLSYRRTSRKNHMKSPCLLPKKMREFLQTSQTTVILQDCSKEATVHLRKMDEKFLKSLTAGLVIVVFFPSI